jgi:hypothetical protein
MEIDCWQRDRAASNMIISFNRAMLGVGTPIAVTHVQVSNSANDWNLAKAICVGRSLMTRTESFRWPAGPLTVSRRSK